MRILIYIFSLIAAVGIIFFQIQTHISPANSYPFPNVVIGNKLIQVTIADELDEQLRGLSKRQFLQDGQGMLFIFKKAKVRNFWMKNMDFPIDIIWLNNNKIINISKELPPEEDHPQNTYSSIYPVNFVLEVPSGYVQNNNISKGNKVLFNF